MKIAIYDPASRKVLQTITTKKIRKSQLAVIGERPYVIFANDIDLKGATLDADDNPVFEPAIETDFKRPVVNELPVIDDINIYIDQIQNVKDLRDLLKGMLGSRSKHKYRIDMNALSDITAEDLPLFQAAINE